MSVWASALISHQWKDFPWNATRQIAAALEPRAGENFWRLASESGSADYDFTKYGEVSFISDGFSLKLTGQVLSLTCIHRWSLFLTDAGVRHEFASACRRVAELTVAEEVLFLPEGTIVADVLYHNAGADFQRLKNLASEKWGTPNLEMEKVYAPNELEQMGKSRVSYFLVKTRSLPAFQRHS